VGPNEQNQSKGNKRTPDWHDTTARIKIPLVFSDDTAIVTIYFAATGLSSDYNGRMDKTNKKTKYKKIDGT